MRFPIRYALIALIAAGGALCAQTQPGPELKVGAERLATEARRSEDAYRSLAILCDRIGNRLSGSPQLDQAIAWAQARMKEAGLQNVHAEKVMVPHWVRNGERGEVLLPARHRLNLLGLGMSVPTPRGGITADAVVVSSFAELDKLDRSRVEGRIVVFDEPFAGYGATAGYRVVGASAAAREGAVAMLLRSVTPVSLDTPHTGVMHYEDDAPRIPAAAITIEDATMLHRMQGRGERIQIHLEMGCETLPDAPSANVLGEVRGREKPEEIVLVGGHLDSWDVGQGAQDDGVGAVLAMEAVNLIQRLGLHPRRTVRAVLFTNEENGNRGGLGYRDAHRAELSRHAAMLETDTGAGLIQGFSLQLEGVSAETRQAALERLKGLAPLLEPLGAARMNLGHSGVDVGPSAEAGAPALGAGHDTARYWDVHHSPADTFDKINREDLQKNLAILAIMTYALAEMPERLPAAPMGK